MYRDRRSGSMPAGRRGGVAGRKLKLVALDGGYKPDRALANMKELFEKRGVFAVIGNVGTPTAEKTLPYALEKRLLFFGAFTGAPLLRKDPPDRYVFNYRAGYKEETAALGKYLVEIKKIRSEHQGSHKVWGTVLDKSGTYQVLELE